LHVSGDYGALLGYLILDLLGAAQDFLHSRVPDRAHDDLFVARPNDLLGKILAHFYFQPFLHGSGFVRLFTGPLSTFSDPWYPTLRLAIRPCVAALPSQPLPTRRRTLFTLSSFRSNVHQLRCVLLVVRNQALQGPAEPFSLRCVVEMPFKPCHLPALLLVSSHALLLRLALLGRVLLAGAALDKGSFSYV
jgi:hypothetical protein